MDTLVVLAPDFYSARYLHKYDANVYVYSPPPNAKNTTRRLSRGARAAPFATRPTIPFGTPTPIFATGSSFGTRPFAGKEDFAEESEVGNERHTALGGASPFEGWDPNATPPTSGSPFSPPGQTQTHTAVGGPSPFGVEGAWLSTGFLCDFLLAWGKGGGVGAWAQLPALFLRFDDGWRRADLSLRGRGRRPRVLQLDGPGVDLPAHRSLDSQGRGSCRLIVQTGRAGERLAFSLEGAPEERQSFLAPGGINSHSGGRGESFRGVGPQFVRRSPPAHTPSPPTPSFGNGITTHRISSGGFSSGRPFSSGNGAFPAANADSVPSGSSFPLLNSSISFSSGSSSRPSTSNGAPRLPPLSAVVSSSAFRPSSGHGLPAPSASGSILLPNSLTLRRPSTNDWDYGDSWADRPGTAPGKLATPVVDDSPFSFHPPEQPASFSYVGGGGGNPRKRTLGGPDGPYGAHTDQDEYEYGGESRPQSRRLSVMELCNDRDERPTSSSLGLSSALHRTGSAERERPTTTNGLISRASALVLDDRDQQWEHESRQHAGEQQHFAAEREYQSAVNGRGRRRAGSALDQRQAEADAAMTAAYHHHHQEQVEQAHFYQQQQQAQEFQERRIEEERYQLQQMHQQQAQVYLDPYANPHPHHAQEMGMGAMPLGRLEMGMMEGYPQQHPGHINSLEMERAAAYHAHHHIEAPVDSPELAYQGDSISITEGYHTHTPHPHPHPHHPPAPVETHALEAGSPVSPYSLGYPHTPQLAYSYGETMGGFGMLGRPEDMVKYEGLSPLGMGPDGDLGPLDMNMSMNLIGLGVGGAVG
ncbi:hypothetical protein K438DRAFT_1970230 [Mycena galopus ATCC 62051]|nr:hypothetical protein K438DRAFT_1970230 [Mycena galopus ATCC 62051]